MIERSGTLKEKLLPKPEEEKKTTGQSEKRLQPKKTFQLLADEFGKEKPERQIEEYPPQDEENEEEEDFQGFLKRSKDKAQTLLLDESFVVLEDGNIIFAEAKPTEPLEIMRVGSIYLPSKSKESEEGGVPKKGTFSKLLEVIGRGRATQEQQAPPPVSDKQLKVKKAMRKRKIMRYSACLAYMVALIVAVTLLFKFSMFQDNLLLSNASAANPTVKLSIDNCTLFITDPVDSSIPGPVYVTYRLPTKYKSQSSHSQLVTENSLSLEILNGEDPYYCLIQMYVQPDFVSFDSFEISCARCNITQDTSSPLQVNGLLNVSGELIRANFKDVRVGSFAYQSVTGYLQLNNIESSGVNNINMASEGDIIIQSTQDFLLNATTNTQTFCMAGTTLASRDNGTCAYADQDQPLPAEDEATCSMSWTVCTSEDCNPDSFPTYVVNSKNGNVYANAIPQVGSPVAPTQVVSGHIYKNGIQFSPQADQTLTSFSSLTADQSKGDPFILLNLGDSGSRSSVYTKWVVASAPTYALMKPWWIGTLSASILNGYVEQTNGYLLPGFCPYYPDYTTQNLLDIQTLIQSKIATPNALVTFVNDPSMPLPSDSHQSNTGIFPLIDKGNPDDRWISLGLSASGDIFVQNNDYTQKGEILSTIIISLIIAAYVTYLILTLTCVSLNVMYTKLGEFANHLENYSKLEKPKTDDQQQQDFESKKKKDKAAMASKYDITRVFKHAPSPLAFIDYLSLIMFRQYSNSVAQFYYLLFRERASNDQELNPAQDMIKGTEAKALYEKFCFMNHLNEQKLTDPLNRAVLGSYGFEIVIREDLRSEVLTRLNIKNQTPFLVSSKELKNGDSLDCYIRENVKITQFDEDQVEVETFIKLYNDFCNYNRLATVAISPSLMREKYGINVNFIPQQYIIRAQDNKQAPQFLSYEIPYSKKIMTLFQKGNEPRKHYIIDQTKLENHFNLVMDQTENMSASKVDQATSDLILFPGWQLWDAITVLLHLLLGALITLPLIFFVILNESQYQPWSLKDTYHLVKLEDITHDPAQFILNLYNSFTWNMVLVIMATVLWIFSFFDLMLYYAIMEFPQDKCFKKVEKKNKEGYFNKKSRQVEWIFVFLALAFYFGYIGLVLTWLLLGAFINPNSFLPFASAAVTFVVFVVTKYNSFKQMSKQGTKMIMNYVNKLFGAFINKVLSRITKNLEKINKGQLAGKDIKVPPAEPATQPTSADQSSQASSATTIPESKDSQAIVEVPNKQVVIKPTVVKDYKAQKAQKIREECAKREIPPLFTDFVLAIFTKDDHKATELFQKLVQELNVNLGMSPEGANIITELLFPQGIQKNETATFISVMVLTHVFKMAEMEGVKDLNPELLHQIFNLFNLTEDRYFGSFMRDFKVLLKTFKNNPINEIKSYLSVLDVAAIISKDKPDHWNLKDPCYRLYNIASYLLSREKISPDEQLNSNQTLKSFVKFLPLLFSIYEVPYDVDEPKTFLDHQTTLKTLENFAIAVGVATDSEDDVINSIPSANFIADLLYLGISLIKHEAGDMPRRVTRDIEECFNTDVSSNKVIPFCLNMLNLIFNNPHLFYKRLNKSANGYGISIELQNFLKIITCAHMESFESQFSSSFIEKNSYFIRLAGAMKADPRELLGLIDLLYDKRTSSYALYFLRSILNRMNISYDLAEPLLSVSRLFFSRDENILFQAIKDLELTHGDFLFVGRKILNPHFIPGEAFQDLGISDPIVIAQKDTIFYSSQEQYSAWKAEIRRNLSDNVQKYKKYYEDTTDEAKKATLVHPDVFEDQANLIKFYMSDWRHFIFSRKALTSILITLNNPKNQLKKKLVDIPPGKDFSGVDYLAKVMILSNLQLRNTTGKFDRFDKDKESALFSLAESLGLNPEVFTNFMKLFLLNNQEAITSAFFSFFPDEKDNEMEISKVLSFGGRQATAIQKQLSFISTELPESFDFFGDSTIKFPSELFKKIFYETSFANLSNSTILELVSMKIKKLKLSESTQDSIRYQCNELVLLSKGLIFETSESNLKIYNPRMISLIKIFSEASWEKKKVNLTKFIPMQKDQVENPLKVSIALSGILAVPMREIYKTVKSKPIQQQDAGENQDEEEEDEDEKEPVTCYLGRVFNVYPEVFDLFNIVFERDASQFFQKALPILRRLTRTSVLNTNLLESLFSLSIGEKFNAYNLAEKLMTTPDVIEFFLSLYRLSKKEKRPKELARLEESVALKQTLSKLKINISEFASLLKLLFNEFESEDENSIAVILDKLGFKPKEGEDRIIQVDFIKGILNLTGLPDPKIDILKSKKQSLALQKKTTIFWNSVDMGECKEDAYIIIRLAAGSFLVLEEFKDHLSWIFPSHDEFAGRAILNLTMGLCGMINSNVEMYPELDAEVEVFTTELCSEDGFPFQDPAYKVGSKALPNNTLAYALYLLYQTLDLPPKWVQAFLFDKKAYTCIVEAVPSLKLEFIMAMVLHVRSLNDAVGDLFGLFDWINSTLSFYKQQTGLNPEEGRLTPTESRVFGLLGRIVDIYEFFQNKLTFEFQKVKEMATVFGLLNDPFWTKLFADENAFNTKINQSFFFLLTLKSSNQHKKDLAKEFKEYLQIKPVDFLDKFIKFTQPNLQGDELKCVVGKTIRESITSTYELVSQKIYNHGPKYPGYSMTQLCLIQDLVMLRESSSFSNSRKLHCLHQIILNIERIMMLDDTFFKMSKYKLLKLLGIPLDMQISSIVEWCMNASLLTNQYVTKLELAKSEEERLQVKGYKKFPEERMRYKNPYIFEEVEEELKEEEAKEQLTKMDEEISLKDKKLLENIVDVKTGIPYKDLIKKSMEFERTLMNPDLILLQGISRGDASKALKGEHALNRYDPTGRITKYYMALIGLHSYIKRDRKDRITFRSFLRTLSSHMESDVVTLDEILHFVITKKPVFGEVTNTLEVSDSLLDLLLICLEGKGERDDDEDDGETRFSMVDTILKVLKLPKSHVQALEVIRRVYLLKDPNAWIYVINNLKMPELNMVNQINKDKKGNKDKDKDKDKDKPKEEEHPLVNLVNMINFQKLKKMANAKEENMIYKSFKTNPKTYNECQAQVFDEVILKLGCYSYSPEQKQSLQNNNLIVNLMLRDEIGKAFEAMILNANHDPDPNKSISLSLLENVLNEFGITSQDPHFDADIKYFALYITLCLTNLGSFRTHPNYQRVIKSLIDHLIEEKVLDPFKKNHEKLSHVQTLDSMKLDPKSQVRLCQLLIGAIAWDFNLCVKSFCTFDTLYEGFLLYSIYGTLNMSKILSIEGEDIKPPVSHIKAILPVIFPTLLTKSAPSAFKVDLKAIFEDIIKEHLGTVDLRELPKKLEEQSEKLFTNIVVFDQTNQPRALSYYIGETFEKDIKDTLTTGKNYQTFEDILCSFCDGTILIKLINTFVDREKEDKVGQRIMKNLFHVLMDFKSYLAGNEGASEHVHESFTTFLESINKPDEAELWEKIRFLAPTILDISLMSQKEGGPDLLKEKDDVINKLDNLVSYIEDPKQKRAMLDLLSVILRTDMTVFGKRRDIVKIQYDMEADERLNIFFDNIENTFFPGMDPKDYFKTYRQKLNLLLTLINQDYVQKLKNTHSRVDVIKDMLGILQELKICSKPHVKALMNMLNSNFKKCNSVLISLDKKISPASAKLIVEYLSVIQKYFNSDLKHSQSAIAIQPKRKMDPEEWSQTMKKIKDGTANSRDLFRTIDQEGDANGSINQAEFLIVANRLGLKLSSHRCREIFAKIKGDRVQEADADELNEDEFEQALTYLQEKNLQQALELLGITPEMLTAILIRLVILLILIFIFIFLGIKAFAIGGTFGSIINSVFPAAGGVALGKEKEGDRENLEEENVKDATGKGFDIATSGEL